MTQEPRNEIYTRTMQMLKPALERVASDPTFAKHLELHPLEALAEMRVELDAETRSDLEGKRFSEFWALRRKGVEGPIGLRDLPPQGEGLDAVSGGRMSRFAPPYVPVGPSS